MNERALVVAYTGVIINGDLIYESISPSACGRAESLGRMGECVWALTQASGSVSIHFNSSGEGPSMDCPCVGWRTAAAVVGNPVPVPWPCPLRDVWACPRNALWAMGCGIGNAGHTIQAVPFQVAEYQLFGAPGWDPGVPAAVRVLIVSSSWWMPSQTEHCWISSHTGLESTTPDFPFVVRIRMGAGKLVFLVLPALIYCLDDLVKLKKGSLLVGASFWFGGTNSLLVSPGEVSEEVKAQYYFEMKLLLFPCKPVSICSLQDLRLESWKGLSQQLAGACLKALNYMLMRWWRIILWPEVQDGEPGDLDYFPGFSTDFIQ